MENQQQQIFLDWITAFLPSEKNLSGPLKVQALAGDAGFRRYYRLNTQPSLIAVDSPPNKENNPAYISVAMALQAEGIRTPNVHAVDFAQGFFLLEDFGHDLLQPMLNPESVDRYYQQAQETLIDIQKTVPDPLVFPRFDVQLLKGEMALFSQWFVGELLGITLDKQDIALLDSLFDQLADSALAQPQVVVHRDYHSRNLMILADKTLGVIDFQDAVYGPITYDLVSLLKDCYVRWPAQQMRQRALAYKAQACANIEDDQFLKWFDLMGLQRHIKVMGIFARLALRDGKRGYLEDLPLVIRYSLEAAKNYPESRPFYDWFLQRIVPQLASQEWYSDWQTAGENP
ncbi:MAG TPA: phosphotransferase [Porticoccaceae bacterium]|nr:phosphotransferase [Porticoccaceae bacterium]